MIAHVGGAPLEELLVPFLASGGPMLLLGVKLTFGRAARTTPRRAEQGRGERAPEPRRT